MKFNSSFLFRLLFSCLNHATVFVVAVLSHGVRRLIGKGSILKQPSPLLLVVKHDLPSPTRPQDQGFRNSSNTLPYESDFLFNLNSLVYHACIKGSQYRIRLYHSSLSPHVLLLIHLNTIIQQTNAALRHQGSLLSQHFGIGEKGHL